MRLDAGRLGRICRETGFEPASVVVRSLDVPVTAIARAPYRTFYPASMIKVPLAAAALATAPDLNLRLPIGEANLTANDAESPLVPGYEASLRELLERAITRSDNVATNVLFDVVGRERATDVARRRFGLRATAFHRKLSGSEPLIDDPQWDGVHRNAHPAGDAASMFAAIADDAVEHSALLRELLAGQVWNDKLSLGIRDGDRFLHKTGDTDEVTHDGGILLAQDGRRYVVVAYLDLPSNPEHNARFRPLMRAIREWL
ncbi:MAG TPA: serine hydrolase [Candidatus Tumulicola sp.]|jgi:beta-lactamase class A